MMQQPAANKTNEKIESPDSYRLSLSIDAYGFMKLSHVLFILIAKRERVIQIYLQKRAVLTDLP